MPGYNAVRGPRGAGPTAMPTRHHSGKALAIVLGALLGGLVGSLLTAALLVGASRMGWTGALLPGPRRTFAEVVNNQPREVEFTQGTSSSSEGKGIVPVVQRVGPAVVKIDTLAESTSPFGFPFSDGELKEGEGSGFIINGKERLAVTNNHVVDNARRIRVTLSDKRTFDAEVVGADPIGDIALIRIRGGGTLPEVRFGDSDRLQIGQTVVAIGNPLGFENTVTVGVLSQVGRKLLGQRRGIPLDDLLQTDAAINPGNSGGPLLDADGNVIGMNTAIISDAQGIGFAVAANPIKRAVQDLLEHGRVIRPWIGVTMGFLRPDVVPGSGAAAGEGVVIVQVRPGEPAERAGLASNDVITEADGRKVADVEELRDIIRELHPGEDLRLKGYRDGRPKEWTVRVGEMPPSDRLGF